MAYDWKKTFKKFALIGGEIFVVGAIAYATGQPSLMIFVPILESIRNWIKHRND